jgi:copper chaperone NosL
MKQNHSSGARRAIRSPLRALVLLLAALALAASLGACAKKQPVAIAYSEAICDYCKLPIMDTGYTCQFIVADGTAFSFDDIPCMFQYEHGNPAIKPEVSYVQDKDSKKWVELGQAYFALDSSAPTLHGLGIHPFADQAALKAYLSAHPGAKEIARDALSAYVLEKAKTFK